MAASRAAEPGIPVICRTVEEAYQAGFAAAANWPPPTEEQVIAVARLLGRDRAATELATDAA